MTRAKLTPAYDLGTIIHMATAHAGTPSTQVPE